MEKTYSLSEIVFGTRQKYIELQKRLKRLEELTDISKAKNVSQISYKPVVQKIYESTDKGIEEINIPKLEYELLITPRKMERIIEYIKRKLLANYTASHSYEVSSLAQDKDDNYYLDSILPSDILSIKDQEQFQKIVYEILQSDFLRKSSFCHIKTIPFKEEYAFLGCFISQHPRGIDAWTVIEEGKAKMRHCFEYDASDDSISISAIKLSLNKNIVRKVLETTVYASDLSAYQRFLIDNSVSANKPLIIDDVSEPRVNFAIEESEKSIHLVKKH